MSDDPAKLFNSLRASTVALLGYEDTDHLTAAQQIRVDRAVMLRLLIDDAQARQMRGEPIDVRAFVAASEDLERMVGGNPASPAARFDGNARERLRKLIEKTLMAGDADDAARDAELMWREEQAAVAAASPDGTIVVHARRSAEVASAPAEPAPSEKEHQTSNQPPLPPRDAPIPRHYLANYDEPWRPFSYMFV
jgi:hypothetical protein